MNEYWMKSFSSSQIEDVRQETKAEKKRLAMAVRKKHLGALGMTVSHTSLISPYTPDCSGGHTPVVSLYMAHQHDSHS